MPGVDLQTSRHAAMLRPRTNVLEYSSFVVADFVDSVFDTCSGSAVCASEHPVHASKY